MVYVDKDLNTFGRYKDINIRVRKNATNGNLITAMFPQYDVEIDKGYVRIFYDDFYTTYPLKWWNAPYKREGE